MSHPCRRSAGAICISVLSLSLSGITTMAVASETRSATVPLDLPAIVRQVLSENLEAHMAQQALTQAQAKLAEITAQRRLHLTFSGSASGSHGQVAEPRSTQSFGTIEGTVALPLPNVRRLAAATAEAEAEVRAAQAGLQHTRLDLAYRASDAYYSVLRARDTRDIAADNLAQAERQVEDTRKRVAAGDVPTFDVLKAEVPLAQARVSLARAENTLRQAARTLNSLMARDLSTTVDVASAPQLSPATPTREQVVSDALAHSPDVIGAQADLDASEALLAETRRSCDPDWQIQATHTRTSDPTAYAHLTTLALCVTIPLSDGGVKRQQVRQAEVQVEKNRSAVKLTKQQAQLASEQALLDVQAAQANLTGTQNTLRIAQESLTKARQAYEAGLTTTRDVLDAQLALAQARSDAASAVFDAAVAHAKLDQAIGKEPLP